MTGFVIVVGTVAVGLLGFVAGRFAGYCQAMRDHADAFQDLARLRDEPPKAASN